MAIDALSPLPRLTDMVKKAHEENDSLSRVLAQVGREHEELRRQAPASESAGKIQALRNMARALESENELLGKERDSLEAEARKWAAEVNLQKAQVDDLRVELEAKDKEREAFCARFDRLSSEKMNVLRRAADAEAELEKCKAELSQARGEMADKEDVQAKLSEATKENVTLSEKVRLHVCVSVSGS